MEYYIINIPTVYCEGSKIMSYDIYLKEPLTKEVAKVPAHLMVGGTYMADYHPETGTFTPALNTEAHLNITYNYGCYYYEVYEDKGIREIYGMMGVDSIPILENMIETLINKYQQDGDWIYSKREKTFYYNENGEQIEDPIKAWRDEEQVTTKKIIVDRYEGISTDYWEPTAANAIKPLYQLIALAKMRPDCFWDGD